METLENITKCSFLFSCFFLIVVYYLKNKYIGILIVRAGNKNKNLSPPERGAVLPPIALCIGAVQVE
jgi:hypothetical protein